MSTHLTRWFFTSVALIGVAWTVAAVAGLEVLVKNRQETDFRYCSYLTPIGIDVRISIVSDNNCRMIWFSGPL
jgi:hypothetical protein